MSLKCPLRELPSRTFLPYFSVFSLRIQQVPLVVLHSLINTKGVRSLTSVHLITTILLWFILNVFLMCIQILCDLHNMLLSACAQVRARFTQGKCKVQHITYFHCCDLLVQLIFSLCCCLLRNIVHVHVTFKQGSHHVNVSHKL